MTYDHVPVAIDGAIHDWETSGDAMRHVPEGQRWQWPPPPLCIDGREYHRRQQARRRRR